MPSASLPADGALVRTWYEQHHAWLQAWMRRRLACPHQAADLAHDTFVRVLAAPQPVDIVEPRAFLTTLAQRVLFSFWRRHSLEQAWLDTLATQPQALALALSAEDYAMVREAIETIDCLLNGLPLPVKQAFLLNRLEGMTHRDIAAELGISLASVERYVARAYLHLVRAHGN